MTRRYAQINELLTKHSPLSCLEVGTWNGRRARELLEVCLVYFGFDLFEDATKDDDQREFNVKKHYSLDEVYDYLKNSGLDPVKSFYLFKGDTRTTLPAFVDRLNGKVDLVWIDGGHSLDTIRSDWEYVQRIVHPDSVILFDDYYTEMPARNGEVGCNKVVEPLRHELLPQKDPVLGGGFVQIARVWNEDT